MRTIKRGYVRHSPVSHAATVIRQVPLGFEYYNTVHSHRALGYVSLREFIIARSDVAVQDVSGT